jgi:DNA-binding transcriptional MocR family regulator
MPRRVYPYILVADDLRDQITAGTLKPGQRLPTQPVLARRYDVARNTVWAAVAVLRREGLVESGPGNGVYVRGRPDHLTVVALRPGDVVSARQPTGHERVGHEVPDGVPVLVVTHPDGAVEVYPADSTRLDTGPARRPPDPP